MRFHWDLLDDLGADHREIIVYPDGTVEVFGHDSTGTTEERISSIISHVLAGEVLLS